MRSMTALASGMAIIYASSCVFCTLAAGDHPGGAAAAAVVVTPVAAVTAREARGPGPPAVCAVRALGAMLEGILMYL
jgi:hypothetical protein